MIRNIILLLMVGVIVMLNYLFGSVVSAFISTALVGSLLYYLGLIRFEQIINQQIEIAQNRTPAWQQRISFLIKKYRALFSFMLMTVVFISSLITIKKTTDPGGKEPWFLNNDHYGLANTGIAFNKRLPLYLDNPDSADDGQLIIQRRENFELLTKRFWQPVYAQLSNKKFTPINNIYPFALGNSFSIKHPHYHLQFEKVEDERKGLQKLFTSAEPQWKITVESTDPKLTEEERIPLPFKAELHLPYQELKEGMRLYNYFLDVADWKTTQPQVAKVLERVLHQLGNTYLLANYTENGDKHYTIFPDEAFIKNGFALFINRQAVPPHLETKAEIKPSTNFYVGFHQQHALCRLVEMAADSVGFPGSGKISALIFDHPNRYLLQGPANKQMVGSKNVRFLTNDINDVVHSAAGEGFLLNEGRVQSKEKFHGNMEYRSLQPNTPLSFTLQDANGSGGVKEINTGWFHLKTNNPGINYLFDLRNFADNGFGTFKLLWFAGLLYLSFIAVLLFFPGKNLARIEPILFSVIYTFLQLRLLLFWRLATFPPLENISKFELEHTLLRFDYDWIISWPVPLTLVWTWLFLISLVAYRIWQSRGHSFNPDRWENKILTAVKAAYNRLRERINFIHLPLISPSAAHLKIVVLYSIFLFTCYLLFIFNKAILHQDALTRLLAILLPLLVYCYAATRANALYQFDKKWAPDNRLFFRIKAFAHYLLSNPVFWITILAILYFLLTDRGFAILFSLFILLKNVFLNFLKKPYLSEKTGLWAMITKPHNYWMYGILALAVYLFVLYFKSLFYYLITYKLLTILVVLLLPTVLIWIFYREKKRLRIFLSGITIAYLLLLIFTPTRAWLENKTTNVIRHVQYRASIIHQPIGKMLEENEFSSFQTQKIIETAENQWFINSYINQPYDNEKVFNLRAFSKVGVNYNTQTRDVVVARFLIGEWGQFTMYVLLLLCLMPLLLFLLSFKITDRKHAYRLLPATYAGLLPLLLFFTIALFVWLTATNRFVFFGQDFPFLSLTSRLSVLLPLLLLGITLMQKPVVAVASTAVLRSNSMRYAFVFILIGLFAFTTIKDNALNHSYFSVVAEKTKRHINKDVNGMMQHLQDSLLANGKKASYTAIIHMLSKQNDFKALMENAETDKYTKSILKQLIEKPASGFKINNPVYLQYDNGRYNALYNEHIYMRLPLAESKKVWSGTITEQAPASEVPWATLTYNGDIKSVQLPYFRSDVLSQVQLAILPASWLINEQAPVGILNVENAYNSRARLYIYKNRDRNITQTSVDFAGTCGNQDVAMLSTGKNDFRISFSNLGLVFATNKWVNGTYRLVYPQRENNLWVMHLAEAFRAAYTQDSLLKQSIPISLDYQLVEKSQQAIQQKYAVAKKDNNRFKFTAMSADGDGNVRMMSGHVTNRKNIDPNNKAAIEALRQQHFFFSNVRNERDQWGNANLLAMQLGPGSAIKPLVAAINASQVNAGWENLMMQAAGQAAYTHYAGYKMIKPWKNVDHVNAGLIELPRYIEASSNFYQSVMIFLGSYPQRAYNDGGRKDLSAILQKTAGANARFPALQFRGQTYYLPSWERRKTLWPATNWEEEKRPTYFGNENSLLANGFEINSNLRTKDKDKGDYSPGTFTQSNYTDSNTYQLLQGANGGALLWCFPEQSTFLQSLRAYTERSQNFNLGLKTTALGGYPFVITPAKMLEMYLSLFQQNKKFRLHVTPVENSRSAWQIDSSWANTTSFHQFLARYIFKGMEDVISGGYGTAKALNVLKNKYPAYHFYAKTGTINEEGAAGKDSRRLIVCISNKNMQESQHIGAAGTKLYGVFFTIDNNHNFDWDLLIQLLDGCINSSSFQQYFAP